jgi:hypothetical protein
VNCRVVTHKLLPLLGEIPTLCRAVHWLIALSKVMCWQLIKPTTCNGYSESYVRYSINIKSPSSRLLYNGMWSRIVWLKFSDISQERIASVFNVEKEANYAISKKKTRLLRNSVDQIRRSLGIHILVFRLNYIHCVRLVWEKYRMITLYVFIIKVQCRIRAAAHQLRQDKHQDMKQKTQSCFIRDSDSSPHSELERVCVLSHLL